MVKLQLSQLLAPPASMQTEHELEYAESGQSNREQRKPKETFADRMSKLILDKLQLTIENINIRFHDNKVTDPLVCMHVCVCVCARMCACACRMVIVVLQ
jgi:hypothetical protein